MQLANSYFEPSFTGHHYSRPTLLHDASNRLQRHVLRPHAKVRSSETTLNTFEQHIKQQQKELNKSHKTDQCWEQST